MSQQNGRKRILISVFAKAGIVDYATALQELNWEVVSSGGTADTLLGRDAETKELIPNAPRVPQPIVEVATITGMQPVLKHRVVTLHPAIHAGILATNEMRPELAGLGYEWFDAVCVDLYPFHRGIRKAREELAAGRITAQQAVAIAVEMMDIGGPTLLRGCGKGAVEGRYTVSSLECAHRDRFMTHLRSGSPNDLEFRMRLAHETLELTSAYDKGIIEFLDELLRAGALRQQ